MAETWRAVLASGEVLGVATPQGTRGDATRVAIARNCALWHWPVAEILAPGELTRAELRAQAWREGAEAMRRDAMRACSAIEDNRTEDAQWRRTHGPRATRDEDYHRIFGQAIGADACWDEIRALPVPPCPWGVCCGTGEVPR